MHMSSGQRAVFERLAREFLAQHASLRHEWRVVPSWFAGERLDLVMTPPAPSVPKIWATLRDEQITVGVDHEDSDFESWGRPMTDEQVAAEAFEYFVTQLREHRYIHE